jgi:hypothetical protein
LRARLSIDPDATPPPAVPPAPPPVVEPVKAEPEPVARPRAARSKPAARRLNALEDPGITPGKRDYRSFYVEDSVFARFRAAVYWTSRHPDAAGEVPENMSAAVEEWMRDTAGDLEKRYNQGEVFRMPMTAKRRKSGK